MTAAVDYLLSPLEYDAVCTDLGIDEMPYPVPYTRHGGTMAERDELLGKARESLSAKGYRERDEVVPGIADVLSTVTRASATVDVLAFDGSPVRAVAGRRGRASALVMADRGEYVLRAVTGMSVSDALLALFPEWPAGPGQSISVPWQAFAELGGLQEGGDGDEMDPFFDPAEPSETEVLRRHGLSLSDAGRVSTIAKEHVRGGQFCVSVREPRRDRMRRERVVFSFYDIAAGRYLLVNDGAWVSITPADAKRIAGRIEHAVQQAN